MQSLSESDWTHDLIVVGAGTGGCMAAQTAAEAGLSVLLIDAKPMDEIGDKACGNAVSGIDLDRVGIRQPKEICRVLKGVKLFSPDKKTIFTVDVEHFVLNRHAFGQKLLGDATRAGAEFYDRTKVFGPVMNNGTVGVKTTRGEIFSKLVVDASGYRAVIRNKLPSVEKVCGADMGICYLEVRELEEQIDPDYFLCYLSGMSGASGAIYYWVIPEAKNTANIGIVVQGAPNHPNPKTLFYEWFNLENSKLIRARGGVVPIRRPVRPLCSDDVMFVGDAGCQTNPVSAGGIGLSLRAGQIAGEVAAGVVENGTDLKEYHKRYMNERGRHQVALDTVRRIGASKSDLNYVMREMITNEEVEKVVVGEGVKLPRNIRVLSKGIRRPKLLLKALRVG